jgi:hypothetical protein
MVREVPCYHSKSLTDVGISNFYLLECKIVIWKWEGGQKYSILSDGTVIG